MEINGLPLHALVVHAAVVFGPLAALVGLLYAALPRWRDRLRWPLAVLAAVTLGAVWVAYLSGGQVRDNNEYGGPLADLVETHEARAEVLRVVTTGFAVLCFAAAWWHHRGGTVRTVLAVLVGLSGLVMAVYVVLTGDAGAQVAWFGING